MPLDPDSNETRLAKMRRDLNGGRDPLEEKRNTCPNCGAAVKHPPKMMGHYQDRVGPTTFVCGTVTSPSWLSPLIYCNRGTEP